MLFSSKTARYGTGVVLLTLIVGLLSISIDLLDNHPRAEGKSAGQHSEAGTPQAPNHLVRYPVAKTPLPCSVCYFHKLLNQTLIPATNFVSADDSSFQQTALLQVSVSHIESKSEGNRGPPSA